MKLLALAAALLPACLANGPVVCPFAGTYRSQDGVTQVISFNGMFFVRNETGAAFWATPDGRLHGNDGTNGTFQSNCNVINFIDGGTWVRVSSTTTNTTQEIGVGAPPGVCIGISAQLPKSECMAWQTIFDAWSGTTWANCTETRSTPCDCVSWNPGAHTEKSVNCEDGHITELNFGSELVPGGGHPIGIGLRGTIPTQIGDLSSLTRLNIHTGRLTGTIPEAIGKLTLLRQIWMNGKCDFMHRC
jgi:hypothetical protein